MRAQFSLKIYGESIRCMFKKLAANVYEVSKKIDDENICCIFNDRRQVCMMFRKRLTVNVFAASLKIGDERFQSISKDVR